MDGISVIGILIILAAGLGIAYVVRNSKSLPKNNQVNPTIETGEEPIAMRVADTREQLRTAASGQTVTLLGEPERAIKASVDLFEMFQQTPKSPWSKTGVVSKALVLAGGVWILKVPSQEAGKPIWLRATLLPALSLMKFYKGSDEKPGPARIFRNNDQSEPVPYTLPQDLTPGVTWEIIDIGTFDAKVNGSSEEIEQGDRLYFVTSREQGGKRRLIYLDARKGEAKGSGGLFLAEEFEPSVDVSGLL